jgi:hypothetical protein
MMWQFGWHWQYSVHERRWYSKLKLERVALWMNGSIKEHHVVIIIIIIMAPRLMHLHIESTQGLRRTLFLSDFYGGFSSVGVQR